MIRKMKRIMGAFFIFTFVIAMSGALTVNTYATEISEDFLPDGWTRVDTDLLTDEQIAEIKASLGNEDSIIDPKAPAPGLTSLSIIDIAMDSNKELHVVTKEIGTSRAGTRFVYYNGGGLCPENFNATQLLVGSDRIVYGYIRYFHTGVYYSNALSGTSARVTARSTNAMSPWNQLSTSSSFTFN